MMHATMYEEHEEGRRVAYIAPFQRAVLQAVADLVGNAYAITIREAVAAAMQMEVSYTNLYISLEVLEQRELITGQQDDQIPERVGRVKRNYRITGTGVQELMRG